MHCYSLHCYILFQYISNSFVGLAVVKCAKKCYTLARNKVEARFTKSTAVLTKENRNFRTVEKEKTPKASEAKA